MRIGSPLVWIALWVAACQHGDSAPAGAPSPSTEVESSTGPDQPPAIDRLRRDTRAVLATRRTLQIERLRAYRAGQQFPRNHISQGQIPIFVDEGGRRCAVAELVHAGGDDALVEAVRTGDNYVLIGDLNDGPLVAWIRDSGLTQEEAARIQPSYYRDEIMPRRNENARLQAHFDTVLGQLVANTERSLDIAAERKLCAAGTAGADCDGLGAAPTPGAVARWHRDAAPLSHVSALTAGDHHTCAIHDDGQVSCWREDAEPARIAIAPARDIAARGDHTCAALRSGAVACWGALRFGGGAATEADTPRPVTGVRGATAVAIASSVGCAIGGGGKVACWGAGTSPLRATPVRKLRHAVGLSVTDDEGCAVLRDGGLACWSMRRCGADDDDDGGPCAAAPMTALPVRETAEECLGNERRCPLVRGVKLIAHGPDELFATDANGATRALFWYGFPVVNTRDVPATDVVELRSGQFTCARGADHTVRCWDGYFSDATSPPRPTPAPIGRTPLIATGGDRVCGVDADGVSCWAFRPAL